jgi:electron transport complex protein RnfC
MSQEFPLYPHKTHGGVDVPHHKNTAAKETIVMPLPEMIVIPMVQHIGAPCVPTVKAGDHVYAGTLVGDSTAFVSAPVHSSISGSVTKIDRIMLPGGQMAQAVFIKSDGKMEIDPEIKAPEKITTPEQLVENVRKAGMVGLGGAGFPAHVKLNPDKDKKLDTMIINVAECEPYITSDHREALENTKNVLDGIYKIKEILGVHRVIIAIEENKPDAIEALRKIADNNEMDPNDEVKVLKLKSSYPQGAEKILIQAATGRMVPAGKLPADVGCLVMNIGSVSYIASYMRNGIPLIKKRVTIDGSAVKNPCNVIVPVGTMIKDIIEFTGGYRCEPRKILMGGPMMGIALTSDEVPVLKQNNGILAFDENEAKLMEPTACIRCGRCVAACPMKLMPSLLEKYAVKGDVEMLNKLDIMTCMECGCCSFSCPAGRRIVQSIRLGKNLVRKAGSKK